MKTVIRNIILWSLPLLGLISCGVPKETNVQAKETYVQLKPDLSQYKYIYITPTPEKTKVIGISFSGGNGFTTSASVVPSDVIAGYFMQYGFVRLPELNEALKPQTLVVNYCETGRTSDGLTYSIGVSIQLLDASTYEVVCTSAAEGWTYDTEAESIRRAIIKCLEAIL